MLGFRSFVGWLSVYISAILPLQGFGQVPEKPNIRKPGAQFSQFSSAPSLIQSIMPSIATIRVNDRDGRQLSIGTGFVVDPSGLIATNYHVLTEGREFTVELWPRKVLKVLSVEAFDVPGDFAIIRVDTQSEPLPSLKMGDSESTQQGASVLAFGHPLGLEHSVVRGIISAVRKVNGKNMIQLAMPIEPGNSGGPLVDEEGKVLGIVNIKDLRADNVGFAVPISGIQSLLQNPSPILFDRWVRSPTLDDEQWNPVFGATWQERSGILTARGLGTGFGGRSLCLKKSASPAVPYEISVHVKLNDERGAAGLAFHSDGGDCHYGFYPTNGSMRLTCFQGPVVDSWEIIQEVNTLHYNPDSWNELKVRVEKDRLVCFVNGHAVIESESLKLAEGTVGLAKFRDTVAEFKRFRIGTPVETDELPTNERKLLDEMLRDGVKGTAISDEQIPVLAKSSEAFSSNLLRRSEALKEESRRVTQLAQDISNLPVLQKLKALFEQDDSDDLFRGALWIAALDNPELDHEAYVRKVERMGRQIGDSLPTDASENDRIEALNRFLFEENGFHGSRQEYYHSANSHLDRVIDDREGLPITLSILYIELARWNQIEIQGVGLPGHFVVRHVDKQGDSQLIDVFERGAKISMRDAQRMVREFTQRAAVDEDFHTQTTQEILVRVLRNLIGSAQRTRDDESIVKYCSALVAIDPDEPQYRMMRCVARYRTKRLAGALADVQMLLENSPQGLQTQELLRLKKVIQAELEGL